MNLKLIRLRARTMQVQQPGLAILFALPVLLTILANFLLSGQDLVDLLPDMTLQQASIYMIQRQLFPSVVSFVISILVVGATFSYLDTINPKIEHRTRVLDIFKQDRFTSVFATLILKQAVLFLWGLILYVGSLISTYASIRFLAIYDKVSNPSIPISHATNASDNCWCCTWPDWPHLLPATILQSQSGRIDPLRAITRRRLQGSLWSPSPKS